MENWRVGLIAVSQTLVEVKIQRGIFQSDSLLPQLFVIAMMSLNNVLRKCTGYYQFSKSQEKIYSFMYMDGINVFAKNEKELDTLI